MLMQKAIIYLFFFRLYQSGTTIEVILGYRPRIQEKSWRDEDRYIILIFNRPLRDYTKSSDIKNFQKRNPFRYE